jgi:hypothetical protein
LVMICARRYRPTRPGMFIACAGIVGLLLALPAMHDLLQYLPGTIVRSPARLVYFTLFALSFALGASIDYLLTVGHGKIWVTAAVAVLLLAHGVDLGRHDRRFIRTCAVIDDPDADQQIMGMIGNGRAAIDSGLLFSINRQVDDVGYFDSIALAKPYQALIDLADKPPKWNSQYLDGSDTNVRALQICAVRVMLTTRPMPGGSPSGAGHASVNPVAFPEFVKGVRIGAGRAEFFPLASVITADLPTIHEHLRDREYDLIHRLLIPTGSETPAPGAPIESLPTTVTYVRDNEDQMTISATVPQTGYLRIDEAWDPGWQATVDGKTVPLIAGDDVFLTLPLAPGYHKVQLEFSTPGFAVGCAISVVCLTLLIWTTRRRPRARADRSDPERRGARPYTLGTRTA